MMLEQRVLDFDGRDVLAAGNDDVLGAVAQLHVAIRMFDAEIAGMEPAAGEGFLGRGGIFQIAFHHDISAKHHFAHRDAVGGRGLHRLRVHDVERIERVITHPLPRFQLSLGVGFERVPFRLPVVDDGRTVGFGQAIKMRHLKAGLAHLFQHRSGRRRRGREEFHPMRQRALFLLVGVEQYLHHDRGAAKVRHLLVCDEIVHLFGAHLSQADMHAGLDADRPGKAPAVAMKHRQRPEIDGMPADVGGHDIADREQVRAAMMVDDALRIARRA